MTNLVPFSFESHDIRVLTAAGRDFGVYLDTAKRHTDGTPVRQVKRHAGVLTQLREAA